MELLCSVGKVGFEEPSRVWVEIKIFSELFQEFGVGYCVIGFGEIDVESESRESFQFLFDEVVNDGL